MALGNSRSHFGLVTRFLHWAMAFGVLGMLGLGNRLTEMEVSLSNLWLFGLHKSIGLLLLLLLCLRIAWHLYSPPPHPLPADAAWKGRLARGVHHAFYVLLVAVPLSGWIASAATGIDVVAFGVTLPRIAPVSEAWEDSFVLVHSVLTKGLAALALLHVAGALTRQDGTLARMTYGSLRSSKPQG